ncbi:MAG: hypothetical protein JSV50_22410 [Desulfobacteraceae bacterium]|nr:MAG: hypothetical protein JSV50_22410 [Desulfobacteraceae bacterium]
MKFNILRLLVDTHGCTPVGIYSLKSLPEAYKPNKGYHEHPCRAKIKMIMNGIILWLLLYTIALMVFLVLVKQSVTLRQEGCAQ